MGRGSNRPARWCRSESLPCWRLLADGWSHPDRCLIGEWRCAGRRRAWEAPAGACPPSGVHRKLRKVSEPAELVGARCFAAGQSTELVEAHGIRALRGEIRVDEN